MLPTKAKILGILFVAVVLRILFSLSLPLTGEEIGIATLQAAGQAVKYRQQLPDNIVSVDELKKFVGYSKDHSLKDVFGSLRYAGMHPPFYYVLLHCLLRYFGNTAFVLRSISIFTSLLSIVYLYLLGKTLYDERIGCRCAIIFALSGYGIWIGTWVRPYSLVMLLSIMTTYQVYQLHIGGNLNLGNWKLYIYALMVVLGFYTLYHFLFVFIFQMVFLLMNNFRNRKAFLAIAVVVAITFVSFLPWVPSLLEQMRVVRGGHYYFHEKADLARFIGDAASINSVRFFRIESFSTKVIIVFIFTALTAAVAAKGFLLLLKDVRSRIFVLAFIIHLGFYCGLEAVMGMTTFHNIK